MTLPLSGVAEPFSSLTHLAGAVFCVAAARPLVCSVPAGPARRTMVVFCSACAVLLLMSGMFHLLPLGSESRAFFGRLDHAAIFVLIAGTFTPIHGILFERHYRWVPIIGIWVLAVTGITLQVIFSSRIPEAVSLSVYLGVGWLGAITAAMLWRKYHFRFVRMILFGCCAYTIGGLLDFARRPVFIEGVVGSHEIFHVAVLVGIFCHWRFMKSICLFSGETACTVGNAPSDLTPRGQRLPAAVGGESRSPQ